VWVHGGAFTTGGSSQPVYDGARLAAEQDVVVVTINYRLGALGFVCLDDATPDGDVVANAGLHDQLAALRWVRDHAAALGGNPETLTVFGESAGAGSILHLVSAMGSDPPFTRAIAQSGEPRTIAREEAKSVAAAFAAGVLWLLLRETPPGDPAPPVGAIRAGLLLAASGAVLAAVPDVVLVSDSYGEGMRRMNTVFKCFMGAWPLLALGGALLLPLALATRHARVFVRIAVISALVGALAHPLSAIVFRAKWIGVLDGLDGLGWMAREAPGDRDAVFWLRSHAVEGAVLAEATGNAYTDYGRIGAATGIPTVLGWENHEGLWRGGRSIAETTARKDALRAIYSSEDSEAVFNLLHRYKVRYVFVGALEKRDFGPSAFPLRANFRRAFSGGDAAVFEILK